MIKKLAIAYIEDKVRFLGTDGLNEICFSEEYDFKGTEEILTKSRTEKQNELGYFIKDIIESNNLYSDYTGFLIDSSVAFINTIPIDYNDDTGSINSNILWELANYYPDNYKNFNVNYFKIGKCFPENGNTYNTLIVATNSITTDTIQIILKSAKIQADYFNVDTISSLKFLQKAIVEQDSEHILLACKSDSLTFFNFNSEELISFDRLFLPNNSSIDKISSALRSIIPEKLNPNTKILLSGEKSVNEIKLLLSEKYKHCSIINPFDFFNISQNFKGTLPDETSVSSFTPLADILFEKL